MKSIDRPARAERTTGVCGVICIVSVLIVLGSFPTTSEARGRIFGRRHRACCCAPAPALAAAPACCGGHAHTNGAWQCPIYPAGMAGPGLYMYYSCQWAPQSMGGCTRNPQPLFLQVPNAQKCPMDDPETTMESHNCVPTGTRGKGPPDDGCRNGYLGDMPTFDPNEFTIEEFTGKFERGARDFQIRFFKLTHTSPDFILRVGFEDRTGDFDERTEVIDCCGPKGFDVLIDHTNDAFDGAYRVLLRRNGPTVCRPN